MLSGEKPFRVKSGNDAAEIASKLNDFPSPLRKYNSDVVPEVEDFGSDPFEVDALLNVFYPRR